MICLAKLSGQHTPTGIGQWIRPRYRALREALAAHWRPAPSVNTIRRTLPKQRVAPRENELIAAPRLLAQLDRRGKVVSGDAMFTVGLLSKLGFHNLASAQRRFDATNSFHLGNYL